MRLLVFVKQNTGSSTPKLDPNLNPNLNPKMGDSTVQSVSVVVVVSERQGENHFSLN